MGVYTRTELSEVSGIPARTIRYYQAVGLLPKPERGKTVVYSDEHRERLGHIATLQARGLKLDAIREVFETGGYNGVDEPDWSSMFAPQEQLGTAPLLTDTQLSELLGERRGEMLADLISAGYVLPHNDGWRVPDYTALVGALMLFDVGTDVTVSAVLWKLIRSRIAELADAVIATFVDAAGGGYAGEGTRTDLLQFMDRYRDTARAVGGQYLAEEIERAINELPR